MFTMGNHFFALIVIVMHILLITIKTFLSFFVILSELRMRSVLKWLAYFYFFLLLLYFAHFFFLVSSFMFTFLNKIYQTAAQHAKVMLNWLKWTICIEIDLHKIIIFHKQKLFHFYRLSYFFKKSKKKIFFLKN